MRVTVLCNFYFVGESSESPGVLFDSVWNRDLIIPFFKETFSYWYSVKSTSKCLV